jgi:hypothetical protein
LYGLYKAAKDGAPPTDPSELSPSVEVNGIADGGGSESPALKQYQAWKDSSSNFSQFEAQKYFILTLKTLLPDWDYLLE